MVQYIPEAVPVSSPVAVQQLEVDSKEVAADRVIYSTDI